MHTEKLKYTEINTATHNASRFVTSEDQQQRTLSADCSCLTEEILYLPEDNNIEQNTIEKHAEFRENI